MKNKPLTEKQQKQNMDLASEIMGVYTSVTSKTAKDSLHVLPKEYLAHGKLIQATVEDEYGKLARAFDAKYPSMPLGHVIGVHSLAANAVGMCVSQMVVRMSALLLEQCLDLPGMSAKYEAIKTDMRSQLHVRHLLFQMVMHSILANMTNSEMAQLHAESVMLEQNEEERNSKIH